MTLPWHRRLHVAGPDFGRALGLRRRREGEAGGQHDACEPGRGERGAPRGPDKAAQPAGGG